jgi:hypothetical protein
MYDFKELRAKARRHIAQDGRIPVGELTDGYEGMERLMAMDVLWNVLIEHLNGMKNSVGAAR